MGSIKEKNRKIKSCDILPLTIFLNEGRVQSHKERVCPTKNNFSQWRGQVTVEEGRVKKEGVAQRKLGVVLQGTPTHKMGSAQYGPCGR